MIGSVWAALALLAADPTTQTPQATPAPVEAERPAACQEDAAGEIDMAACAAGAPEGSSWRSLALINLARDAYLAGDVQRAVDLYDQAQPAGTAIRSDFLFHAFRSDALRRVGRTEEALADAERSWSLISTSEGSTLPQPPLNDDSRAMTLALILPTLKASGSAVFPQALAAYEALPANGWAGLADKAGVLEQLGDLDGAVAAIEQARAEAPEHAGVLNNHCYILTQAGRAGEGLESCERAVELAPQAAPIRHSHAAALAALGRCAEAERELAEARRLDPASREYQEPLTCG